LDEKISPRRCMDTAVEESFRFTGPGLKTPRTVLASITVTDPCVFAAYITEVDTEGDEGRFLDPKGDDGGGEMPPSQILAVANPRLNMLESTLLSKGFPI
jgi:hypothetical protein